MAIDQITSSEFVDKLRSALLSRTRRYDTGFGPIADLNLALATVLEDQNNNRLRVLSLLLSLSNPNSFSQADLDATVFNEGLIRPDGGTAVVTLTFQRRRPFGSDSGVIPRGYPVGSSPDEVSGSPITFITTEAKDKSQAVTVLDTDTNSTVYELNVPAVAIIKGSAGQVGPNRVNRPLQPLVGYDSITNKEQAQSGRDAYTNAELIELYLLAVASRQLSVPQGSEFHVRDTFLGVQDVHEVFGTDSLLSRAATDAGAVDSFVIADGLLTQTDQLPFFGVGQKLVLSTPPVVRVDSVTRVSDSHLYVEGTDYVVSLDTSGVSGSVRARDGIRFLPTASSMPAVGDVIRVVYAYNDTVHVLQADAQDPEVQVQGRDNLFRLGTRVDIFLTANMRAVKNFTPGDVKALVQQALLDYINGLGLAASVEGSDLQAVVRKISGVDNFIITKLVRSATGVGTSDVLIAGNEYPRLDAANITITPV